MSLTFDWIEHCIKQIDVTNIGKQHSLVSTISDAKIKNELFNLEDIKL